MAFLFIQVSKENMEGTVHCTAFQWEKATDNYVIENVRMNTLVLTLALPSPQQHRNTISNMKNNSKFHCKFTYQLPVSKNRIIRVVTLGIVSGLELG